MMTTSLRPLHLQNLPSLLRPRGELGPAMSVVAGLTDLSTLEAPKDLTLSPQEHFSPATAHARYEAAEEVEDSEVEVTEVHQKPIDAHPHASNTFQGPSPIRTKRWVKGKAASVKVRPTWSR
jgi:hypothetical protein